MNLQARLETAITKISRSPGAELTKGQEVTDSDLPQILDDVWDSLVLPNKRLKEQTVIFIVGLVATGKTTVAKRIEEERPLVRLSTDELRWYLMGRGFNLERVREIAMRLLVRLLESGYSVISDADAAGNGVYELSRLLLKDVDVRQLWVHVVAPESVIYERLSQPASPERQFVGEAAIACYERRKPLHATLPMTFDATVDTSTRIEPVLEELFSRLQVA